MLRLSATTLKEVSLVPVSQGTLAMDLVALVSRNNVQSYCL